MEESMHFDRIEGGLTALQPLLRAGLSLSQVCALTGAEGSTVQNWVKRGWVAKPEGKKYFERQFGRILLLNALREGMQLERIVALLAHVNGSVEDRADDSIPEGRLYECLLFVMKRCREENCFAPEAFVEEALADYEGTAEQKQRLSECLRLMSLACAAARLRRLCDEGFSKMFFGER